MYLFMPNSICTLEFLTTDIHVDNATGADHNISFLRHIQIIVILVSCGCPGVKSTSHYHAFVIYVHLAVIIFNNN